MLIRQLQLCDNLSHLDECFSLSFPPSQNRKRSRNKQELGVSPSAVGEDVCWFGCFRFPTSTDRLLICVSQCCCFGVGLCQGYAQLVVFDLAGKGRKLECSENPRYRSVSSVTIICAEVRGCIVCCGHFLHQAQPVRLKLLSFFSHVPGREGKDTPVANKEAELQWRGFHLSAAFIFGRLSSLYEDGAAVCLLVFSLPFTSSMTVLRTKTRAKPSISITG